jgi:hypothetical protein
LRLYDFGDAKQKTRDETGFEEARVDDIRKLAIMKREAEEGETEKPWY